MTLQHLAYINSLYKVSLLLRLASVPFGVSVFLRTESEKEIKSKSMNSTSDKDFFFFAHSLMHPQYSPLLPMFPPYLAAGQFPNTVMEQKKIDF